jgi:hypothetical protein
MNLLNSFGKRGVEYGLLRRNVDIEDTEYLSKYFVVSELNTRFTPGKNSISFNGSTLLKPGSEILVECLDADGNSLFVEMARTQDTIYKETTSFVISIHVYGDTVGGDGKLILFGTAKSARTVRWVRDITIDKSTSNKSKVRFYKKPSLEVTAIQSPVIGTSLSSLLSKQVTLTGSFHTLAIDPKRDTSRIHINKNTLDIDYRLFHSNHDQGTHPSGSINSQLIGFPITLHIDTIREPFSYRIIPNFTTQSFVVKDVLNDTTIKLDEAFYYKDNNNSNIVSNISSGRFFVTYPFIGYNTGSTDYLTLGTGDDAEIIYNSYAQITYRNLKTFTGYVDRHKLYRRSLYAAGDFQLISDERLKSKEILEDNITQNKAFNKIGSFYNQNHVDRYWFVNDGTVDLTHTPVKLIDGMRVSANYYNYFDGGIYLIAKNDSVKDERNSNYIPYDEEQYLITSGSSYDSNFIELKKDVLYILSTDLYIEKEKFNKNASVEFYLTSSVSDARKEKTFTNQYGIKLGELIIDESTSEKIFTSNDRVEFLYTPENDLYGTIVIVPKECFITLSDLSLKPYGDDGFSPEILNTKILFPVTTPNESFEIKAELFDVDSNLVYSELRTIQAFDPSGSTLNVYIPGYNNAMAGVPGDFTVGGSLNVKGFVNISGSNVRFKDMTNCPAPPYVLGYNLSNGTICYTATPGGGSGNASYDDDYIYVNSIATSIRVQGERRIDNAI